MTKFSMVLTGAFLFFAPKSFSTAWKCYEFQLVNLGTPERPEASRNVTLGFVERAGHQIPYYAHVISLNETVDDFLSSLNNGERICLKGEYAPVAGRRIFAYEARRE